MLQLEKRLAVLKLRLRFPFRSPAGASIHGAFEVADNLNGIPSQPEDDVQRANGPAFHHSVEGAVNSDDK